MTESIIRTKKPGDKLSDDYTINVSEEMAPDRCGALLVNPKGHPDWVTDPLGDRARIITVFKTTEPRTCSQCSCELPIGTEVLVANMPSDESKLWYVYTCPAENLFIWEGRDRP